MNSVSESNRLDSLGNDIRLHSNQRSCFDRFAAVNICHNALVTTTVVNQESLCIIFLLVSEKLNK